MKKWYLSKTLITNALFVIAAIAQNIFGYAISPEAQIEVLALVNIILRIITKEELTS